MKWLCAVGVAVSLAAQPTLAETASGNLPLTPEARDAFVTDLLGKMTVDEKIGQLRLISVGPDNPKEAIRDMIGKGQVGGDLQHRHPPGYPGDAGSGDDAGPPEDPALFRL
jgi:beta-glucosidase